MIDTPAEIGRASWDSAANAGLRGQLFAIMEFRKRLCKTYAAYLKALKKPTPRKRGLATARDSAYFLSALAASLKFGCVFTSGRANREQHSRAKAALNRHRHWPCPRSCNITARSHRPDILYSLPPCHKSSVQAPSCISALHPSALDHCALAMNCAGTST